MSIDKARGELAEIFSHGRSDVARIEALVNAILDERAATPAAETEGDAAEAKLLMKRPRAAQIRQIASNYSRELGEASRSLFDIATDWDAITILLRSRDARAALAGPKPKDTT